MLACGGARRLILNSVVRTPVPAGMSVSAAYPAAVSPMALTAPAFRKKAAHKEVNRAEAPALQPEAEANVSRTDLNQPLV